MIRTVRYALVAALVLAACSPRASAPNTTTAAPGPAGNAAAPPSAAFAPSPRSTAARRLRVLTTNDLHGALLASEQSWSGGQKVGGAAALVAYFRLEEQRFGGPTIRLDGGDLYQGTPISNLTEGRSTIDYFNAAGYAAAALGNHEFDWGVRVLGERAAQARFPFLAANVFYARSDSAPGWIRPTAIVRVPGPRDTVTVGIIGFSTQATPITTRAQNVVGLEFRDPVPEIERWVRELRPRADFVIVVAHEGAQCDPAPSAACAGVILDVARRLRQRPDLIVGGHTHQVVATRVNGIAVVEAGTGGQRYGVVDLTRSPGDSVVTADIVGVPVAWTDSVQADASTAAMIARYLGQIGPQVNRVIATTTQPMPRGNGPGDYELGRLIADAQRAAAGADVAIMNNGGIRANVDAGPVTWTELFTLQPFANRMIELGLRGDRLRAALEHGVASGVARIHVSGISFSFDPSRPVGQRVTRVELDGGRPLVDSETYSVVVNDFLATGGDGFTAFQNPISLDDTGIIDLDALIDWVQKLPQPISAPAQARIRVTP